MRTIISGRVTPDVLDRADFIMGIVPTRFVTNGATRTDLPTDVYPIDPKLGEAGEIARDYSLVQQADALIVVGRNPHLVGLARMYGLLVHQE